MIFLHVGTHKTGTSLMQNDVFPKFRGIEYVPPWSPVDAILRLDKNRNYLLSNERFAGRLWATPSEVDSNVRELSRIFPGAKILMSFRAHDGFILSSYKQYLHQGGFIEWGDYFDIEHDNALMSREQFLYRPRVESIAKHFGESPFVFLLEEIKTAMPKLLSDLGSFLSATVPSVDEIEMKTKNQGVNYYQAQVLRRLNKLNRSEFNPQGRFRLNNRFASALRLDPRRLCQDWLRFLPDSGSFVTEQERGKIQDFYREDWEYLLSCREQRLGPTSD